jgi:threonine dehydratase
MTQVEYGNTPFSVEAVNDAMLRIDNFISATPVYHCVALSEALDADVWLKLETASQISSFKLRGALNALLVAQGRNAVDLIVTSSTGNHGQAVAYAAQLLAREAHVFVPTHTLAVKKVMISLFGGILHEGGMDIDEAKDAARDFAKKRGALFVDDGESLDVINGAGTVGIEVARAISNVDYMFVPMGSGSLATGAALALKANQPKARVIAVQSEGSRAMHDSFKLKTPVERAVDTIGDGIVCRVPARLALEGVLTYVDDVELVSDLELLSAMRCYLSRAHLLAEPAAAAALAGAAHRRTSLRGRRVVLIVTGSNVSEEVVSQCMAAPELFAPTAGRYIRVPRRHRIG